MRRPRRSRVSTSCRCASQGGIRCALSMIARKQDMARVQSDRSTLYVSVELSRSTWLVTSLSPRSAGNDAPPRLRPSQQHRKPGHFATLYMVQETANWLERRPEIEIVSRDRCGLYAQGIRQGAPQARQVADRFHLLQNLREAIERQMT